MVHEQITALVLTIGVIVVNLLASWRAFRIGIYCDTDCKWTCQTSDKPTAIKLVMGFGIICLILALLKLWSIHDVFLHNWANMSTEYHWRSYLYLTENYGVAILCWHVGSLVKRIGSCGDTNS